MSSVGSTSVTSSNAATVTTVSEFGDCDGSLSVESGQQTFQRKFLVEITGPDIYGWLIAQSDSKIPRRGDQDSVTKLTCVSVSSTRNEGGDSGRRFIVTCTYKDDPIMASAALPWSRKDRVELNFRKWNVPLEHDYSTPSKPIVNIVGDKPGNPVTHEAVNPLYRVKRQRQATVFDITKAEAAIDTVNDADIHLYELNKTINIPKYMGRLCNVIATPLIWYNVGGAPAQINYYDITFELEVAGAYVRNTTGDMRTIRLQHTGQNCFATANTASTKGRCYYTMPDLNNLPNPMKTPAGKIAQFPVTQPVYLELNGTQTTDLSAEHLATLFLDFKRFPTADWSEFMSAPV